MNDKYIKHHQLVGKDKLKIMIWHYKPIRITKNFKMIKPRFDKNAKELEHS